MDFRCRVTMGAVAVLITAVLGVALVCPAAAQVVYQTNYDSLAVGQTQPFPGSPAQDG